MHVSSYHKAYYYAIAAGRLLNLFPEPCLAHVLLQELGIEVSWHHAVREMMRSE